MGRKVTFHAPAVPPQIMQAKSFTTDLACEQCTATNEDGKRCTRKTCFTLPMCWQHLQNKMHLQRKRVPGKGFGLFAKDPKEKAHAIVFRQRQWIAPLGGEVVTKGEMDRRYGQHNAPYGVQITKDLFADGLGERGVGCNANTIMGKPLKDGRLPSIASGTNAWIKIRNRSPWLQVQDHKVIRNGQEILNSYGKSYLDEPRATVRVH